MITRLAPALFAASLLAGCLPPPPEEPAPPPPPVEPGPAPADVLNAPIEVEPEAVVIPSSG